MFKKPKVSENVKIDFPKINEDKIKEILTNHDFSKERIEKQLEKLEELKERRKQKKLF
jgi:uncharacterized protein Smg (DUF494 family)